MPDTVIDLLQNVAYIGCTYSLSRARREGELIPAQWSPIVGRDLFEQAQAVLRRNRRVSRGSVRPHYAFSRLLVCGECGRPLRASTNYGLSYYACRRDLAPEARCPATRRGVREDGLLAWADALFQRLDALAPEGFSEAVAGALSQPQQSPEALAQIDTTMERLRKLYLWQHVSEPEVPARAGTAGGAARRPGRQHQGGGAGDPPGGHRQRLASGGTHHQARDASRSL